MKKNVFFISLALLIGLSTWTAKAATIATVGSAAQGGADGTYTTLQLAVAKIIDGTLTGDVELQLVGNTLETALSAIPASGTGSANYTSVTIYPSGAARTIITSTLGSQIITIAGSNVTINGRIDKTGASGLSITNSRAAATAPSTILIEAPATATSLTNVRVEYCTISAANTSGSKGNIVINFAATPTAAIGNIYIQNNTITGRSTNSIFAKGVSALLPTTGLNISNNNFENCANLGSASFGINVDANHTGATISNNNYYDNAFVPTGGYGITAISLGGFGHTISDNYIGGSSANHSGTLTKSTANNGAFTGIALVTIAGTASSIQGNTIAGISWISTTNNFKGIAVSGAGNVNVGTVTANTIGSATGTGSIVFKPSGGTASLGIFTGIEISTTGIADVQKNTVAAITTGTSGSTLANLIGINKTAVAGTTTISNNVVGSLTEAGSINCSNSVAAQVLYPINCAGTGTNTISNNIVSNIVNYTTTGNTYSLRINPTSASTTTVNANFIQKLYMPSSTSGSIYGIYIETGVGTYTNNIISITTDNPVNIYGIHDAGASGNNSNIYHNTVYIAGSPATLALNSQALNLGAAAVNTCNIKNNIFMNARTNTGSATGKHYAARFAHPTSYAGITLDYNNYYAPGGFVGQYGTTDVASPASGTAVTILSGQDVNSIYSDPAFANAATPAVAIDFIPATTLAGIDLSATVSNDYAGVARTTQMGAFNKSVFTDINSLSLANAVYQQGLAIVVDMSALEGLQTISIYDLQGKSRLSLQAIGGTKTTIENSLKSGIYIVKIQGAEKTFVSKLMLK